MFCRFGSELESLPVAVTVWLNDVCTLVVTGFIRPNMESTYVDFSFESCRKLRISAGSSWLAARVMRTSSSVESPFFVFFTGFSFNFSNKTEANCLGELMLNSAPAIA